MDSEVHTQQQGTSWWRCQGGKRLGGDSPPYIQTCSAQYDDSPCTEYNVQFTASTTYETEITVKCEQYSILSNGARLL